MGRRGNFPPRQGKGTPWKSDAPETPQADESGELPAPLEA